MKGAFGEAAPLQLQVRDCALPHSPLEAVTSTQPDSNRPHRLAGAVEKFNRSKDHFDALRAEMNAFFHADPRPYGSRGEFDPVAHEWIERFQVVKPPALRFGAIFGDSVHFCKKAMLAEIEAAGFLLSNGERDRRGETLFIDARRMGRKISRTQIELTDDEIERIVSCYHRWRGNQTMGAQYQRARCT